MKRFLAAAFIVLFLFTTSGCGSRGNGDLSLVGGEYRAQWEDDYRYDTPILIDSYQEWLEFLETHPAQSSNEDVLEQDYSQDFFADHVIYAYIKGEASGSNTLTAKGAARKDNILQLTMERFVPDQGTDDLAARICVFGLKREDLKGIQEVEVIILEKDS